jgi:imidazolonepropionase-like amidohydrolase
MAGMTVMPGLIDLHVHLCAVPYACAGHAVPGRTGPVSPRVVPETEEVLWGARHAAADLEAGFTTVRDAFSYSTETGALSLRHAAETGLIKSPRIFAAGYAGMTGSIVDMRHPPSMSRPYGYVADGPWELRKRTREVIRGGFNWIKTFTSGGRAPGQQEDDTWYTNHTIEELQAIIDEAHNFDIRVMVHATTPEAIRLAVRCGADTIEHGWPLDDELIQLMLDHETILVPTLSVYSRRGFLADGVPQSLKTRAERQVEIRTESFERAYKAGVKIANGSDIAPSLPTMSHGENAFELTCMVRAGMSAADAIRAATSVAAQALGISSELGTIEPGKQADLVVVAGDPLADIGVIEKGPRYVFQRGQLVHDRSPQRAL